MFNKFTDIYFNVLGFWGFGGGVVFFLFAFLLLFVFTWIVTSWSDDKDFWFYIDYNCLLFILDSFWTHSGLLLD